VIVVIRGCHWQRAMRWLKLLRYCSAEAKRELETSGLLIGPTFDNPGEQWLAEIRLAIRQQNRIRIQYQDEQQRSSERCLWPFALAFFDNIRVLVAWCELRQDFRHFRTDRIADLQRLDERYPASRQQLLQQWRAQQGITTDRN
jgi:predicted DNA-binding transcriptional regulator YafY